MNEITSVCPNPPHFVQDKERCGLLGKDVSLRDKVYRAAIFSIAALVIAFFVSQGCLLFFKDVMIIRSTNVLYYAEVVPAILAITAIALNWLVLAAQYFY